MGPIKPTGWKGSSLVQHAAKIGATAGLLRKDQQPTPKKRGNPYKFKKLVAPGGTEIISLQGHEPMCLQDMVKKEGLEYKDIVHKRSDMPCIRYLQEGNTKRYFPDFWIPKKNQIIEVKSQYTYDINRAVNLAKKQACLDAGYQFQFRIYDRKGFVKTI